MTATKTASANKGFPWLVILVALPALGVLLALGTWQVQRLAWKEGLLANIDARLSAAPTPIAELLVDLDEGRISQSELDYLPVSASGRFRHEGEQHFFATHRGATGYYIYTPLELTEPSGLFLLINRGFVPFDLKEAETRPQTLSAGEVTITGLARQRLEEKPSWAVPENDPVGNIYYWKDIEQMAVQANLSGQIVPFFVDEGSPRAPGTMGEWPVSGVTLINLPNNHLQYAITWYGLALTLVGVVAFFVAGRLRGSDNTSNPD
ncbi:MAG: SURF1 family protein [Pseudomonadota bacterium]